MGVSLATVKTIAADLLLHGIWQLVAAWYALDDNVLVLDTRCLECFLGSVEQRIDDLGVPACVYDTDP